MIFGKVSYIKVKGMIQEGDGQEWLFVCEKLAKWPRMIWTVVRKAGQWWRAIEKYFPIATLAPPQAE